MPTGDPFCACGCGAWLGQCRNFGRSIPNLPPVFSSDERMADLERRISELEERLARQEKAGLVEQGLAFYQAIQERGRRMRGV